MNDRKTGGGAQPVVLLVDDESRPAHLYIRALEQNGFRVMQRFDPESALEFVKSEGHNIVAIILDVMMPPGKYGDKATKSGLATGVLLCADLREQCPEVPILVTTNMVTEDILGQFSDYSLLQVVQKIDYPPSDLVEILKEMIEEGDVS